MSYCRKCGKELTNTESFCSNCGTKVEGINLSDALSSVKRGTAQISEKVVQNVQKSDFKGKLTNTFNEVGNDKKMIFVVVGLFVLNFIMSFFDMVDISFLFSSKSTSFLGLFNLIKEYYGYYYGNVRYVVLILNICNLLILASAILTVLPLLLKKKYNGKFLILNYFSSIIVFLVYLILIMVCEDAGDGYVTVKPMAYLYIIESFVAFICTINFSKKLRAKKNDFAIKNEDINIE